MTSVNRQMLLIAAKELGELKDELVVVGGSIVELFITDEGANEVRQTNDVDTIVEAVSYSEYQSFAARLKSIGFLEDTSDGAPICRWVKPHLTLDVMPSNESTLGFSNRWFAEAAKNSIEVELDERSVINSESPLYFIATKIAAFESRGNHDFFASHDLLP